MKINIPQIVFQNFLPLLLLPFLFILAIVYQILVFTNYLIQDSTQSKKKEQNIDDTNLQFLIIGAGFSGLGMAKQLKDVSVSQFRIIQKGDQVGGTWFWNKYPGCGVDTHSHNYTFSFFQNPKWTSPYPLAHEISAYLQQMSEQSNLKRHIHFKTVIKSILYDEKLQIWRVSTDNGQCYISKYVISASGPMHEPVIPEFKGKDQFQGPAFHSALWNQKMKIANKTVTLIGNGATAIQVLPELLKNGVKRVFYIHSKPFWIAQRNNYQYSQLTKLILSHCSIILRVYRWILYIQYEQYYLVFIQFHSSKISQLMTKLLQKTILQNIFPNGFNEQDESENQRREHIMKVILPQIPPGIKRILISDEYLPSLLDERVELIDQKIDEIHQNSISLRGDGTSEIRQSFNTDCIIFATGFRIAGKCFQVIGKNKANLYQDIWSKQKKSYLGICVPKFPNFFMIMGPHTGLGTGSTSVVYLIECQINYILNLHQFARQNRLEQIQVQQKAVENWSQKMKKLIEKSIWGKKNFQKYGLKIPNNYNYYPQSNYWYWYDTLFDNIRENFHS